MSDWYWLSFATETGFLGAAVVPASDITEAIVVARDGDYNPGGEVLGMRIPEGKEPPAKWRGRLLSADEVQQMDAEHGASVN